MDEFATLIARQMDDIFDRPLGNGFTIPQPAKLAIINVLNDALSVEAAKAIGVILGGEIDDLVICFDAENPPRGRVTVFCAGKNRPGRVLIFGKSANYRGLIHLDSPKTLCVIGDAGEGPFHATVAIRGNGAALFIGSGATSNGARIMIQGHGTGIAIGDDCMFANDIEISASDCHAIIDLKTQAVVNPPRNTIIGPHVWIGARTIVLKGRTIGYGSIISAGALVTSDVPPMSLTGGFPNKILRSEVTWSRHNYPNALGIRTEIERMTVLGEIDANA